MNISTISTPVRDCMECPFVKTHLGTPLCNHPLNKSDAVYRLIPDLRIIPVFCPLRENFTTMNIFLKRDAILENKSNLN